MSLNKTTSNIEEKDKYIKYFNDIQEARQWLLKVVDEY